uniref:Uncharacterized protein n=1 Tax=Spongospora subterranea TaxID=70186 RepID=A0A0H5REH9_9EUKA|eukprot:CRZ12413.1 hypothetical protein [Spongospora subterranea]
MSVATEDWMRCRHYLHEYMACLHIWMLVTLIVKSDDTTLFNTLFNEYICHLLTGQYLHRVCLKNQRAKHQISFQYLVAVAFSTQLLDFNSFSMTSFALHSILFGVVSKLDYQTNRSNNDLSIHSGTEINPKKATILAKSHC